ncbi:MAG: DnaJ domain-containing protein, partial [Candidatus Micrarchaeota archaeon]|nr:DnaJ domain-containing protein [Candidatus Micrarchaeota archaeon]
MSILDKTVKRIREFNDNRRTKLAASLLEKTIEAERKFLREAKRFGIEPNNINFRNYYEILGIKYTNDQKAIRQAYIELIKRYHPDVNKGAMATQITKDVNEAYGVLKDEKKKADYDSKFSKGENRMGPEVISALYNELMNKYNQLRNKDF